MFSPYPSTVRYVRLCVNIVIRAVAFSASAGIMASLSIPLKWLLDYLMAVFGVHERVQVVVSQIAIGFPVTLALAILFVGVMDIINLMIASIRSPSDIRRDFDDERESDRE